MTKKLEGVFTLLGVTVVDAVGISVNHDSARTVRRIHISL